MLKSAIHLYQIAWNDASFAAVEPGYMLLDNRANPRPDWYEYWPIRQFFLHHVPECDDFYGFFSTRFSRKTGLSHEQASAFVRQKAEQGADVVLFSPQPDMAASFLNVFEQQNVFSPGFVACCQKFCDEVGIAADLSSMIMDSRTIVFCNYFAAKPAFWHRWLSLCDRLFALAEDPASQLHPLLTTGTNYPGGVQFKVFLMERIASLLLNTDKTFTPAAHNPWSMAWSGTKLNQFVTDAILSDAVKIAINTHSFPEYSRVFSMLRHQLAEKLNHVGANPA